MNNTPSPDEFQGLLEEISRSFMAEVAKAFGPVAERIHTIYEAFYGAIWQSYIANGAIYGNNTDGMLRWLRERAEIEQLRMKANELEAQHRDLAIFKANLAEKKKARRGGWRA